MSTIQIMTDSASDISVEDEKAYDIDVIPFPISLGGKSYISRVDFNNEEFFDLMKQCDEIPATAQITPFQFIEIYTKQAEKGVEDLVLVLINSKGSSTYDNAVQAVDMFYDEHPEHKDTFHIHCFDGLGYNSVYGAPVVQAAKMNKNGASVTEIVNYLTETLPKRQIYFGIYDLKYAGKSGRIPSAAAFVGSKLNIKPVMKIFDREITTAAKCRGERKLIDKVVDLALEDMAEGEPYEVLYGDNKEDCDKITKLMTEKVGYPPSSAYQIGAAVAANAGPRVVGVGFNRKN